MSRTLCTRLLTAIALTMIALPASAICRYKDANGRTVYADSAPPGFSCEGTVKPPATSGAAPSSGGNSSGGAAAGGQSYQEKEMEFRKRRLEKAEAEKKMQADLAEVQRKKDNCQAARNRVSGLQIGGRVVKFDANGERQFLGDEDIARELADAKQQMEMACKGM